MNSWEEDALFEQYGWFKDLIQREYQAPDGEHWLSFEDVMQMTSEGPEGEAELRYIVREFGRMPDGVQRL